MTRSRSQLVAPVLLTGASTVLAAALYVAFEWGFFFTKPSLLSAAPVGDALLVLGIAPLPVALTALVPVAALALLVFALGQAPLAGFFAKVARLVPAAILTGLFVILFDNFTYTLFDIGIKGSSWMGRVVYAMGITLVLSLVHAWLGRVQAGWIDRRRSRRVFFAAGGVVAVGILCALVRAAGYEAVAVGGDPDSALGAARLPNVLLIGLDGVEAEHTSLFGGERDTTPFLREFLSDALVCENAFVNAGQTGASLTALLTGRLPLETDTHHRPYTLLGDDRYLHLPGLLGRLGYHRVQITARPYADAVDTNMLRAFDVANSRRPTAPGDGWVPAPVAERFAATSSFLGQVSERIEVRLRHVFTGDVPDPFEITAKGRDRRAFYTDATSRMPDVLAFLDDAPRPFFLHAHLLGTHGPNYYLDPGDRRWSQPDEDDGPYDVDAYDDAIARLDRDVAAIVERLRLRGLLEDTIVVIYSDHGRTHNVGARVPLAFRFPGGARAGSVVANAQTIDVAPSLLDALGQAPPAWMTGASLVGAGPDPVRPVIAVQPSREVLMTPVEEAGRPGGPGDRGSTRADGAARRVTFEADVSGISYVQVTVGDQFHRFDTEEQVLVEGRVAGHTAPLDPVRQPDAAAVRGLAFAHLRLHGALRSDG